MSKIDSIIFKVDKAKGHVLQKGSRLTGRTCAKLKKTKSWTTTTATATLKTLKGN
jgi:hypothetical protein